MKKCPPFLAVCFIIMIGTTGMAGDDKANDFQSSKNWSKLDSGMQQAWQSFQKDGNGDVDLQSFVVNSENVDMANQSFLLAAGFVTQVATGNIARGHLKVKDLPRVADVYFVKKVKSAN